jgi:hypothetical protein
LHILFLGLYNNDPGADDFVRHLRHRPHFLHVMHPHNMRTIQDGHSHRGPGCINQRACRILPGSVIQE